MNLKGNGSRIVLFLVVAVSVSVLIWPRQRPGVDPARKPAIDLNIAASGVPDLMAIRVKLTPNPVASADIAIDGPYTVRPVGNERVLGGDDRLAATTVKSHPTGLRIGGKSYSASRLEVTPRNSPAIWINGHQYRGVMRIYRHQSGKLSVVNVLPLEQYIASVVDSEMPAAFPDEARKAQAVVARTYALYQSTQKGPNALYDVFADTRSQKYLGYKYRAASGKMLAGETEKGRRIARETRGIVCVYNNRLYCTYYSAVCGGHTIEGKELFSDASAAVAAVACDFCREAKYYRWEFSLAREDLERRLNPLSEKNSGRLQSLARINANQPGRLARYEARFANGRQVVSGDRLRTALSSAGARSPNFDIDQSGGRYTIHGRGHGHGVGLCQWGACGQAKQGRAMREILAYYYPGSDIVRLTTNSASQKK